MLLRMLQLGIQQITARQRGAARHHPCPAQAPSTSAYASPTDPTDHERFCPDDSSLGLVRPKDPQMIVT